MSLHVAVLFLLILGSSTDSSCTTKFHDGTPLVSANDYSALGNSYVDGPDIDDHRSKTLGCDPKWYSVEEGTEPGTHSVKIVRGGTVLHTIKLLTDEERNGFGFNGAKKTQEGVEISIEYGSRLYYHKTFTFICRQHNFYLSKIRVDSFDKHNPEKWKSKVIRVRPYLPLQKFVITDFMQEGSVHDLKPPQMRRYISCCAFSGR